MKMMLLAVVVACFIVGGVHPQQDCNTYDYRNDTNFDPSWLYGTWYGMLESEMAYFTTCYYITFSPPVDGNDGFTLNGWYFVKLFGNVTLYAGDIVTVPDDYNYSKLCLPEVNEGEKVIFHGVGTVSTETFATLSLPSGASTRLDLTFQVYQIDTCSHLNVRICVAFPNVLITNNYLVYVRDPRNAAALSTAQDLMKTNTMLPLHNINETKCKF